MRLTLVVVMRYGSLLTTLLIQMLSQVCKILSRFLTDPFKDTPRLTFLLVLKIIMIDGCSLGRLSTITISARTFSTRYQRQVCDLAFSLGDAISSMLLPGFITGHGFLSPGSKFLSQADPEQDLPMQQGYFGDDFG
ncbi:hypothetical protein PanWU01x14_112820 [Parasponia andersonii]|uniref:Uncharacterized protein n=1 Tax=Parasponia andersonii TaxID=3476 RepID=A0A2P5CYJ0_PARAD|nr:hypothetical protein PanWU01x14_112820 [Parasponia andersonii]